MFESICEFGNRRWRGALAVALLAIVLGYGALTVRILAVRVAFPWDILTCFETSFMNAMLKLHNGQSIYSPPEQANSEVYPPGVHYLTYALLRPLHRELDIRWCRAVAVLASLVAALLAGALMIRLAEALAPPQRLPWIWRVFLLAAAFLTIHKNMTSDAPHPDNLHMLHAAAALLLCWTALTRESFRWALAAAAWAGLGILTKQTAILAPVAAALVLLAGRRWGAARSAVLATLGAAIAGGLALALGRGLSGYHLFRAMSNHRLVDIPILLGSPFLQGGDLSPLIFPPRLLLIFLTLPAIVYALAEKKSRLFVLAWAGFGIFEAAPAFVALLKEGGNFNNLGAIDLWLAMLAYPVALHAHRRLREAAAAPALAALVAALLVFLTLGLYPLKMAPRRDAWPFCRTVERQIGDDLRAGKRLWVPTGAMFLIHAGRTEPLQDLSINIWSAEQAQFDNLGIVQRLRNRDYDAIYYIFPWPLSLRATILENYALVRHIDGPAWAGRRDVRGVQPYLTSGCDVFAPKPPAER